MNGKFGEESIATLLEWLYKHTLSYLVYYYFLICLGGGDSRLKTISEFEVCFWETSKTHRYIWGKKVKTTSDFRIDL